jgi:hypothetical protein
VDVFVRVDVLVMCVWYSMECTCSYCMYFVVIV